MSLGFNVNFVGYSGFLIIVAKEAANPSAIVHQSAPIPFDVDQVYTIPNTNPVVHIIEFWRSATGATKDFLLRTWQMDVLSKIKSETFYYVVGGSQTVNGILVDPLPGATGLRDARLKDKYPYKVEMRGTGFRIPILEWVDRSDDGGGFDFVTVGEEMVEEDKIAVTIDYAVNNTSGGGGSSNGGEYIGTNIVINSGAIDDTFYRKKNIAAAASSGILTHTFPAFSSIPNTRMRFSTFGTTIRHWYLPFEPGDTVKIQGRNATMLCLGKDEVLELEFIDGVVYVMDLPMGYSEVCRRKLVDYLGVNEMLADGAASNGNADYTLIDYPRIAERLAILPPSQVITSFATWNTIAGRRMWYYNIGAGKFRPPDDREMTYKALKTFDGSTDADRSTNVPGGYQADAVDPSSIKIQVLNGSGGSSTNTIATNQGFSGMDSNIGYTSEALGAALIKLTGSTGGTRVRNTGLLAVVGI